jgi:uncharacterized protein (DUF2235 family)
MRRYSFDDKKRHWHWLVGAFNQPRNIQRSAKESDVWLHDSVLQRMKQCPDYQPKNLPQSEAAILSMFRIEH